MKKTLQISNILAFVLVIFMNYLSNTGVLNNTTIGGISDNVRSLFTPAGYAFAIWGIIYLLLLGFIIFQSRSLFVKVKNDDFILKTGWWFVLSCLANSLWVLLWIYEYTGLSVICIFALLFTLLQIVMKNDMELWDAPLGIIGFLWWPFVVYSGWVTVASIANVSSYLVKIEWNGFGISDVSWTIIMIVVAGVVNLIVTWKRHMREFALVGAWALAAIAVANWDTNQTIAYSAIFVAAILFGSSSIHGFRNRATSPFVKLNELLNR